MIGLEKLSWEHYIAIGLLLKNDGFIYRANVERFDPQIAFALGDLHERGLVDYGESIFGTMPSYSLNDKGKKYIENLSEQGVKLFPPSIGEDWEYPQHFKDLELKLI